MITPIPCSRIHPACGDRKFGRDAAIQARFRPLPRQPVFVHRANGKGPTIQKPAIPVHNSWLRAPEGYRNGYPRQNWPTGSGSSHHACRKLLAPIPAWRRRNAGQARSHSARSTETCLNSAHSLDLDFIKIAKALRRSIALAQPETGS